MITRRGFLGVLAGVMAAPAVVKAESLMRIVVPKREIIVPSIMPTVYFYDSVIEPNFNTAEVMIRHERLHAEQMKRHRERVMRNSIFGGHIQDIRISRDVFLKRPPGLNSLPTPDATKQIIALYKDLELQHART